MKEGTRENEQFLGHRGRTRRIFLKKSKGALFSFLGIGMTYFGWQYHEGLQNTEKLLETFYSVGISQGESDNLQSVFVKKEEEKEPVCSGNTVICHLSDIHLDHPDSVNQIKKVLLSIKKRALEVLGGGGKFILATTGDFVTCSNSHVFRSETDQSFFSDALIQTFGIFDDLKNNDNFSLLGSRGNHDNAISWSRSLAGLLREHCGLMKEGEMKKISGIDIMSLPDEGTDGNSFSGPMEADFWRLATSSTRSVFLCHNPEFLNRLDLSKAQNCLFLCGHTHGNQYKGDYWLSDRLSRWYQDSLFRYDSDYLNGLYECEGAKGVYVHVSPGVGNTCDIPQRVRGEDSLPTVSYFRFSEKLSS